MFLFSNSRIFVLAKNNFNHIKENFLDFQRRNNASVSPRQAIECTCPFTGFNQPFCPQLDICPYLQERQPNLSFVSFWLNFITVIAIIVEFWIFTFTLLRILRITVWKILREVVLLFLLFLFSGSVDTIVLYKTGNHLPQHLWFSRSFFTVDGCIDCVEGILNS